VGEQQTRFDYSTKEDAQSYSKESRPFFDEQPPTFGKRPQKEEYVLQFRSSQLKCKHVVEEEDEADLSAATRVHVQPREDAADVQPAVQAPDHPLARGRAKKPPTQAPQLRACNNKETIAPSSITKTEDLSVREHSSTEQKRIKKKLTCSTLTKTNECILRL